MHALDVLVTFAGALGAALALGFLAHRVGLSPIVGYLLAGIAVGPFTPGFVANREVAEQFSEIGVILLLFGVGLHFNLRELFAVWKIALPGALLQSAVTTLLLAAVLRLIGWSWPAGLVLGAGVAVASTVVMALVLGARHDLHAPIGHIAIGWTVVEDLLTVTLLLLLPIVLGPGGGLGAALGLAAVKIAALVAIVVVLGRWVIPWTLERIAATRSRELFTLAVLVLAIGIAVGAAKGFGVSIALGAFLAGLAVGRSELAARAASDVVPMRDAFAVLFFVSVGMLCDPRAVVRAPLVTLVVLVAVVVGKPLVGALTVRLLGRPKSIALPVGMALGQVGEFSFILGALARRLGVLDDTGWNALVAAAIVSIAVNPSAYALARRLATRMAPIAVRPPQPIDPRRCIIVGFGPVGRTVHRLLSRLGGVTTIVDLNLETVRGLRAEGHAAVYGDVLRAGTLEEAGIATAGTLILAAELEAGPAVVQQARLANPQLKVLARCAHLRSAAALRREGAEVVVGEAEVAVALAEATVADPADGLLERDALRQDLLERYF